MSDDHRDLITPEMIEAEVKKTLAEAAKLEAEAAKAMAEARRATAEAEKAENETAKHNLEVQKAMEDDKARKAKDEYHRIYRFIGGVDGTKVNACIAKLTEWHRNDPECEIEVIFNSPGGDVIDGMALFDFLVSLRESGHLVITGCTGYAASMAGILVQAGDIRWMSRESWLMIHQTAFGAIGKSYEVEDRVEWIKQIEKRIIDIFCERSNLTARKVATKWKRKDWWIDSKEALALGLVDEVRASQLKPLKSVYEKKNQE